MEGFGDRIATHLKECENIQYVPSMCFRKADNANMMAGDLTHSHPCPQHTVVVLFFL